MNQSCPEYYRLADGRPLLEYMKEVLIFHRGFPELNGFEIHCLFSAMEHLFRMGAKPSQEQHDKDAYHYWMNQLWDSIDSRLFFEASRISELARKISRFESFFRAERQRAGRDFHSCDDFCQNIKSSTEIDLAYIKRLQKNQNDK